MRLTSVAAAALSCALFTLAMPASATAVNLVSNGSFEQTGNANTQQAANSWSIYSSIVGWTGAPNIEVRNNVSGSTPFGSSYVELDTNKPGNANSAIWQMLNTVAGQSYELSFSYAQRPDHKGLASNGLCWQVGNEVCRAFGQDLNLGWTTLTVQFTAQDSQTQLRFAAIGTADTYGTSLDNVSVFALTNTAQAYSKVPEPASLALALLGLTAGGLSARRRRNAAS
jgi:hypothetical protein